MLTPAFHIKQECNFVTIIIKAPHTKISDAEIHIDGIDFRFYSKPYYLRLTLPGPLVEDGRETAIYEADTGEFVVRVPKEEPGQLFDGLDMLTKLLAPPGKKTAKQPLIEVIDGKESTYVDNDEEEEIDWSLEQVLYKEDNMSSNGPVYGFANKRSGVLKRLQSELHEVIDMKEADHIPSSERAALKIEEEQDKFDQEHYLGDLYEDDSVEDVLKYKPFWTSDYKRLKSGEALDTIVSFTDEEKEAMLKLPRKEYLLDEQETLVVYLGLVDILYAYAYNVRSAQGENNVESSWTVCKLSSTLSWLQSFSNLKEVTVSCLKRSLIYPLYRHWKLAKRVLRDTRQLLYLGKKVVLKCLLDLHQLLSEGDSHYILNDLYITDYCVWIQSASDIQLKSLARNIKEMQIMKADVELDLDDLEVAASLALEEELETRDLTDDMSQLSLGATENNKNQNIVNSNDLKSSNKENETDQNVKDLTEITSQLDIKLINEIDVTNHSDHAESDVDITR